MMRPFVRAIGLAVMIQAATAAAQPAADFSMLHVKVGDTVYVTDATTGVEVSGPLKTVSPSELSIDGSAFTPRPGLKIERRGDPVWEGAAVGFVLGTFALYPVIPEFVGPRGRSIRPANGLMWGVIGALIDRAHVGRTTIYDRTSDAPGRSARRVIPQFGMHKKGIALAFTF